MPLGKLADIYSANTAIFSSDGEFHDLKIAVNSFYNNTISVIERVNIILYTITNYPRSEMTVPRWKV